MKIRGSVSAFAVLMLASCSWAPNQYLPNGYIYQDDTNLSSPPPSRPWFKSAEGTNLDRMGDNRAAWQGAVYELINPLPGTVPQAGTKISLKTTPPSNEADRSFEHYLREGLASYGYTVNTGPELSGTILVYNVAPISSEESFKIADAKYGRDAVRKDNRNLYFLTLDVRDAQGKTLSHQATVATLPFEAKEFWPGDSLRR